MQYTYTIFQKSVPGLMPVRLDTTTRADRLVYDNVTNGRYVEVTDNTTLKTIKTLSTIDELDGWVVAQERTHAWKPHMKEIESCVPRPVDSNLKTAAAIGKPRVSDVPPVAFYAMGAAMSDGAKKYGRFNWRETGVTASVFYDAMRRHLDDWYAGQDHAIDSKIHHLAHMMAGGAIMLDAIAMNKFNDDRDPQGPLATDSSNWMAG